MMRTGSKMRWGFRCRIDMENSIIITRYLRAVAILGSNLGLTLNLIFLKAMSKGIAKSWSMSRVDEIAK